MEKHIELELKTVYGRDHYYPANDLAKKFCKLFSKVEKRPVKTIIPEVVQDLKDLGYIVTLIANTKEL